MGVKTCTHLSHLVRFPGILHQIITTPLANISKIVKIPGNLTRYLRCMHIVNPIGSIL